MIDTAADMGPEPGSTSREQLYLASKKLPNFIASIINIFIYLATSIKNNDDKMLDNNVNLGRNITSNTLIALYGIIIINGFISALRLDDGTSFRKLTFDERNKNKLLKFLAYISGRELDNKSSANTPLVIIYILIFVLSFALNLLINSSIILSNKYKNKTRLLSLIQLIPIPVIVIGNELRKSKIIEGLVDPIPIGLTVETNTARLKMELNKQLHNNNYM